MDEYDGKEKCRTSLEENINDLPTYVRKVELRKSAVSEIAAQPYGGIVIGAHSLHRSSQDRNPAISWVQPGHDLGAECLVTQEAASSQPD